MDIVQKNGLPKIYVQRKYLFVLFIFWLLAMNIILDGKLF